MPAPPHVVQTLADIDALRARLNDTERTLRTIYALPELSEVPSPAPPADTVSVAPARVVKRGQVRKDGRYYHVVRAHEREAVES